MLDSALRFQPGYSQHNLIDRAVRLIVCAIFEGSVDPSDLVTFGNSDPSVCVLPPHLVEVVGGGSDDVHNHAVLFVVSANVLN